MPAISTEATEATLATLGTLGTTTLTIPQLETVYDTLAESIDQAGGERTALFLTKLCLLLANQLGDDAKFAALAKTALADL